VALSRALAVSVDYLVESSVSPPTMLDHSAFCYRAEDQFQRTMGSFLAEGIERSEAILAVTTGPNIELLREHLGGAARSVEFVDSSSFLTTPTAALDAFRAFTEDNLGRGAPWVRILGEPRWAGRSDFEVRVWTRFESLLNLVLGASPLTAVCPYDVRSVAPEIVTQAHHTHPNTIDERGTSQNPHYADPASFALEAE
jgi:hypothetical protein